MDYDKKLKEYTIGFTLIVAYSVGETNKVHSFGFANDDKTIFNHIEKWEKHFEKQKENTEGTNVNYTCTLSIIRNLHYKNINQFAVLDISKEELKTFFA